MTTYIFVTKDLKEIIDKDDFGGERPALEALGYAKALTKKLKKKVYAFVMLGNQ